MGVGLIAGPAARLEGRQDDLQAAVAAGGQELVDGVQAVVRDSSPIGAPDDPSERRLVDEQLGDPQVEGAGDPLDGRDRRARHLALHLGKEALGHAGSLGELAESHPAGLAQRPDARAKLKLRGSHRPATLRTSRSGTRPAEV